MSGGGGGGGGGDFDRPATDCSRLRFEAHVASPVAAVLSALTVGEVLDVAQVNQSGTVSVVLNKKNGQRVGGLASPQVAQLRKCMDDGFDFQAVVLSINGAQVRVRVEPKT
jgi:hypothetical protein